MARLPSHSASPTRKTHTGGVDDIVQAQFGDDRVELEQQGQRLSDSTCQAKGAREQVSLGKTESRRMVWVSGDLPAAPATTALTILDEEF